MNKEESLSFLQSCIDKVNQATAEDVQFYKEMYNKNCPIEEQESSSDAVDKAEVKKIAKEMYLEVANMDIDATTISDCISCTASKCREVLERKLQALPPATPTRKKGRWENGNPICPCCGEDKFKDLDADIWADWKPRYCPNCGSYMEVER